MKKLLPLDISQYRNDLARSYNNRGSALIEIGTPESLAQAIASYNEAIEISEPLNMKVLEFARTRSNTYGNQSLAYLRLDKPEEAADSADEGLVILKNLEIDGVFVLRPYREELFGRCLRAYRASQPQFLPEIILEHLDPENAGSAPNSLSMHESALKMLAKVMSHWRTAENEAADERQKQIASERFQEVIHTLFRLQDIQTLYFAGTLDSAKLQASFYENAGDPGKAAQVYRDYLERCPNDPEGWLSLADFRRKRNRDEAREYYEKGAVCLINSTPSPDEIAGVLAERLTAIAETVCRMDLKTLPDVANRDARQQVDSAFFSIRSWLALFERQHDETLKGQLKPCLEKLWNTLENEREEWFRQYEVALADTAGREQLKQWVAQHKAIAERQFRVMAVFFCKGISVKWSNAAEAITSAFMSLQEAYKTRWTEAIASDDKEKIEEIETEIADAMGRRLKEELPRVAQSELKQSEAEVEATLGKEIWAALSAEEKRLLATGLHCFEDAVMQQYAGLIFGQSLEECLSQRVFSPLKTYLRKNDYLLPEEEESKKPTFAATQFFNGQWNHLMLGQMVGIFAGVFMEEKGFGARPDHPAYRLIWDALMQLPRGSLMIPEDKSIRKSRKRALFDIAEIRNQIAHLKTDSEPSSDKLRQSWQYLAADEDAFLRYFIGAHLEG